MTPWRSFAAAAGDRARIEVNSERLGLAGNWNRCAALARTPLVAIFHQDDVMLPGHLSAHAASFAADSSIGLTASASVVIDERGRPVSPAVVEQGGLGPIDRVFDAGSARVVDGGRQPAPLFGGDAARRRLRTRWAASTRGCRTSSTGIAGCGYRENGRLPGWRGRPFRSAGIPPARPTVSRQGWPTSTRPSAMLEPLFDARSQGSCRSARLRRAAHDRLGRAFLNRAHDALRAGLAELAREAYSGDFNDRRA